MITLIIQYTHFLNVVYSQLNAVTLVLSIMVRDRMPELCAVSGNTFTNMYIARLFQ